jgi:hypothetical protein
MVGTVFINFISNLLTTYLINIEIYLYWINNYLPNCNSNMIIFTNKDCYEFIKKMRINHLDKTKIIILEIEDFYTYKYYNYWLNDLNRDPEKNLHNIDLYMIWNEKCKFFSKIQLNFDRLF